MSSNEWKEVFDPYKILNISENASEEEIKDAYKAISSIYSPGTNSGYINSQEAAKKYSNVNKAYLAAMKNLKKKTVVEEAAKAKEEKPLERLPENTDDIYFGNYTDYVEGAKYYKGGRGGAYYEYGEEQKDERLKDKGDRYHAYHGFSGVEREDDFFNGQYRGAFDPKFLEFLDFSFINQDAFGTDSPTYKNAIKSMEAKDFYVAAEILDRIELRHALWYYLSAVAYRGCGDIIKAREKAIVAYNMEQDNPKFWEFLKFIESSTKSYTDKTMVYTSAKKTKKDGKVTSVITGGMVIFAGLSFYGTFCNGAPCFDGRYPSIPWFWKPISYNCYGL